MKKMETKIYNRIVDHCKTNYKKLDNKQFVLGSAPINYKCHINSVQKTKEGKAKKIILCLADSGYGLCVHFINQLEDGKYQDNTWGYLYEKSDYYLIKELDESEYDTIGDILSATQQSLVDLNSSAFERKFFKVKYNII